MAEFITARHKDVEGTAHIARSALAHLPGWEEVAEDETSEEATEQPSPQRGTRRKS